jgi:beta-lactamase superfamily II metal-dependent hydrolase
VLKVYDGIEVDMMKLGDADSILVTQWVGSSAHRVLIDGGAGADAPAVADFLRGRNATSLWAVLCSHPHNDHAGGLANLVQDRSILIQNAWMHDIRNHVGADALRRASSGNSATSDAVRQVVETTKELAAAFAGRGLVPQEPFAGAMVSGYPPVRVLGPTTSYYESVLAEFTGADGTTPQAPLSLQWAASVLGGVPPRLPAGAHPMTAGPLPASSFYSALSGLAFPGASAPSPGLGAIPVPLTGLLAQSSVKEAPTTQPFNNTSAVLGVVFKGERLLFTADAGSEALARVPVEWGHLLWMGVPHHGSDGNLSQQDIERFCPRFAYISARGDSSHPSRAIVSGLVKAGAQVFSTHQNNGLRFYQGRVPARPNYVAAVAMRGTGNPEPDYLRILGGRG